MDEFNDQHSSMERKRETGVGVYNSTPTDKEREINGEHWSVVSPTLLWTIARDMTRDMQPIRRH